MLRRTWGGLIGGRGLVGGYTVELPNKGHFGNESFVLCSEVVPISEVQLYNPQIIFHGPKPYIDKMKELVDCLTASGLA